MSACAAPERRATRGGEMSNLREAAQQALEALENPARLVPYNGEWRSMQSIAVTALRTALAQQDGPEPVAWMCPDDPEPETAFSWEAGHCKICGKQCIPLYAALEQQAEPAATFAENATTQQRVVETPPSDYRRGYWDGFNIGKREGRIEAADARAQQAEPVQEPVGWRIRAVGSMGWRGPWRAYWQSARPGVNEPEFCEFEPLYTAPPQRKPLTDEEIEKLFGGAVADVPRAHWLRQAAIEVVRKTARAHGIGEVE